MSSVIAIAKTPSVNASTLATSREDRAPLATVATTTSVGRPDGPGGRDDQVSPAPALQQSYRLAGGRVSLSCFADFP
jgi:hypothetical protein